MIWKKEMIVINPILLHPDSLVEGSEIPESMLYRIKYSEKQKEDKNYKKANR